MDCYGNRAVKSVFDQARVTT